MPRKYVSYDGQDGGSKLPPLTAEQARKMAPTREDVIQFAMNKINMAIMAAANEGKEFARIYPYDLRDVSKFDGALFDIKIRLIERGFYVHVNEEAFPIGVSWVERSLSKEEYDELLGPEIQLTELESRGKMLKKYTPDKDVALREVSRNIAEQISAAMWQGKTWITVAEDDVRFLAAHGLALDMVKNLKFLGFTVEYTEPSGGFLSGKSFADGGIKVMFY